MFNKTYQTYAWPPQVNATTTITEHNAPTVEQARYLDELREQARKDVLDGIIIGCVFGEVVVQQRPSPSEMAIEYDVAFKINGKLEEMRFTLSDVEIMMANEPEQIARAIFKEMAKLFIDRHLGGAHVMQLLPKNGRKL